MKTLIAILMASAMLAVPRPSQAMLWYLFGTGTANAWDKQLAHDVAFQEAVTKALSTCTGTMDGGVELEAKYDTLPSGQWRATVRVRAACNFLDSDGNM